MIADVKELVTGLASRLGPLARRCRDARGEGWVRVRGLYVVSVFDETWITGTCSPGVFLPVHVNHPCGGARYPPAQNSHHLCHYSYPRKVTNHRVVARTMRAVTQMVTQSATKYQFEVVVSRFEPKQPLPPATGGVAVLWTRGSKTAMTGERQIDEDSSSSTGRCTPVWFEEQLQLICTLFRDTNGFSEKLCTLALLENRMVGKLAGTRTLGKCKVDISPFAALDGTPTEPRALAVELLRSQKSIGTLHVKIKSRWIREAADGATVTSAAIVASSRLPTAALDSGRFSEMSDDSMSELDSGSECSDAADAGQARLSELDDWPSSPGPGPPSASESEASPQGAPVAARGATMPGGRLAPLPRARASLLVKSAVQSTAPEALPQAPSSEAVSRAHTAMATAAAAAAKASEETDAPPARSQTASGLPPAPCQAACQATTGASNGSNGSNGSAAAAATIAATIAVAVDEAEAPPAELSKNTSRSGSATATMMSSDALGDAPGDRPAKGHTARLVATLAERTAALETLTKLETGELQLRVRALELERAMVRNSVMQRASLFAILTCCSLNVATILCSATASAGVSPALAGLQVLARRIAFGSAAYFSVRVLMAIRTFGKLQRGENEGNLNEYLLESKRGGLAARV